MTSCEAISTLEQFVDALRIRVAVFIQEQGFPPGWEPDEIDKVAKHYVARLENVTVATARAHSTEGGSLKIERMAVLKPYRNMHIGTHLTQHVVADIQQANGHKIWLNAQTHAASFYERVGFRVISEQHYPCGTRVPHVAMEYDGGPVGRA